MKRVAILFALTSILACQSHAPRPTPSVPQGASVQKRSDNQAVGRKYAISTQGVFASKAAERVFAAGGNIIDAAVAASFAISVERPQSTGLGGGGFLLFRQASSGQVFAVDFRERAPRRSRSDLFLGKDGKTDPRKSQDGILAVGTPGLVAGLAQIHARFGKLPLATVLEPAIELAEEGFNVYPHLANALRSRAEALRRDPGARRIFLDAQGQPWPVGHRLVQKDLAGTLREIAQGGSKVFYEGSFARRLVKFSRT